MKFRSDNKIVYGHDMRFLRGIPSNVDFEVYPFNGKGFKLIADGYGSEKEYGSGAIHISGTSLTSNQRKRFEKHVKEKS